MENNETPSQNKGEANDKITESTIKAKEDNKISKNDPQEIVEHNEDLKGDDLVKENEADVEEVKEHIEIAKDEEEKGLPDNAKLNRREEMKTEDNCNEVCEPETKDEVVHEEVKVVNDKEEQKKEIADKSPPKNEDTKRSEEKKLHEEEEEKGMPVEDTSKHETVEHLEADTRKSDIAEEKVQDKAKESTITEEKKGEAKEEASIVESETSNEKKANLEDIKEGSTSIDETSKDISKQVENSAEDSAKSSQNSPQTKESTVGIKTDSKEATGKNVSELEEPEHDKHSRVQISAFDEPAEHSADSLEDSKDSNTYSTPRFTEHFDICPAQKFDNYIPRDNTGIDEVEEDKEQSMLEDLVTKLTGDVAGSEELERSENGGCERIKESLLFTLNNQKFASESKSEQDSFIESVDLGDPMKLKVSEQAIKCMLMESLVTKNREERRHFVKSMNAVYCIGNLDKEEAAPKDIVRVTEEDRANHKIKKYLKKVITSSPKRRNSPDCSI
eukprot:TRINITY_DN3064_c0_g2_i1.p1 TRINITY_DN3064_c0_g2~~TRINITY_DN3064_c0_g2_i1.p1  ORF type:complete len:502 (+),score=131.77 TRINITY_DN3064_c0_g2_i1:312-1817(+)